MKTLFTIFVLMPTMFVMLFAIGAIFQTAVWVAGKQRLLTKP